MIAQQILNGIISGAVYALFSLGFTLIFGVNKILNLAHGGIFMAGAFIGFYAAASGLPFWAACLLAMVGAGILANLVDLFAFRRLRTSKHGEFGTMIASIGANMVLISIAQQLSNTQDFRFPFDTIPISFFRVAGLRLSTLQVAIVILVGVLLILLVLYLYKTSFGRQVRAVAGNDRASMLLGVNPDKVYFQTFFISGALAGIAGVLIGLLFNSINFLMGDTYLLRGFVIVILGGLGSIPGAVIAGLCLGVFQSLATSYLPSDLTEVIIYSLLFVGLVFRPNGLFGMDTSAIGAVRR